ncbi:efflux RND transporter periplasmic adaptor subunit [Roseomonas terrae]|uniref:Efflux RND transporter periplasmic adaptor subunit n=1 Tax=Neoroseomonas terrae TaxID=424799 RepID=A0ABS5EB62_9PROT|nr:efflux RND transporter periplasmic adaptor subunit [Neoroseomonas terrae]MBR0648256.1 efflux RND transporter periplasmic adaptor subunit [Neoroseomonas terrae]
MPVFADRWVRGRRATLLTAVLFILPLLSACDDGPSHPAQAASAPARPVDVTVTTLRQQPAPVSIVLPGRTTASQVAEVRPQVGGVLRERLFTEGETVNAGQPLFRIDPAPYQAALDTAEAALARAQATAGSAEITVNRYRPLVRARAVSQQDLDTAEATLRQAQADIASAEAAVDTARINLGYTVVNSPIAGRTGRASVTVGALVTANQASTLVTVTQLNPIYVDMTQPSAALLRQRRDIAEGVLRRESTDRAAAVLILEDGTEYPQRGEIQFSEVIVDQGTGSVTLRAVFPNPDGLLMPGMFVRARVEEGTIDRALLVPQQAVSRTPRGEPMAYVVNAEGVVEQRVLQTSRAIGTNWLVTAGLSPGDRVVMEGIQRIRPGAKVNATEAPAAPAATAAATPARTGG